MLLLGVMTVTVELGLPNVAKGGAYKRKRLSQVDLQLNISRIY
jgi:hypothetical protein